MAGIAQFRPRKIPPCKLHILVLFSNFHHMFQLANVALNQFALPASRDPPPLLVVAAAEQ